MSIRLDPEALAQVTPVATPFTSQTAPLSDLGNPAWQGIGALIGLIGILFAAVTWWQTRRRKELSYQVLTNTRLVSVREENALKGRLKITFDDTPAENLDIRLFVVRIINTGNEPVDDEDFSGRPILFRFGEDSEVLAATVIQTEPAEFDASVSTDGPKALLAPVLFNRGQAITLKILVREPKYFRPYAHIKGTDLREFRDRSPFTRLVGIVLLVASSITAGTIIGLSENVIILNDLRLSLPLGLLIGFVATLGVALWQIASREAR